MKKLLALLTAACMALTATAAPKKEDKAKPGKDTKKEAPAMMWDVVIEGTFTESSEAEIKAMLADLKGLKVDSIAKKDATIEAVVSSTQRFSRSDISRALAKNKSFKVKDFKVKKADKKEEPKKEEPKKTEPKKTEPAKPDAPKPDAPKTDPKADAPKTDAPKADAPKTEEPKKDK
jgi:hypothetical protein